jgi:hypothetical protein
VWRISATNGCYNEEERGKDLGTSWREPGAAGATDSVTDIALRKCKLAKCYVQLKKWDREVKEEANEGINEMRRIEVKVEEEEEEGL